MSRNLLSGSFALFVAGFFFHTSMSSSAQPLPEGFVDASQVVPNLVVDLRYYKTENFVGTRVEGYKSPRCLLTKEAAAALKEVQNELASFGLGLKVFDAYRPQQAVDHFVRWAKDRKDTSTKRDFYPDVDKRLLFEQGYIAAKSSHSRGSTVDLTLVDLTKPEEVAELDMGTPFDFFGKQSWTEHKPLSTEQRANRLLLRALMEKHGFRPYKKEWWHFTLKSEPYPNTYFNFPVE